MTREETLGHIFVQIDGTVYPDDVEDLINTLYDDFESRLCENCKYYEPEYENEDYGVCTDNKYTKNIFTDKDFGCNKFERKTDVNV